MELKKTAAGALLHRIVLWAIAHGGNILCVAIMVILGGVVCFGLWGIMSSTSESIRTMSNPTERGLAYIAAAIVWHSFAGGNTVTVKRDPKDP